MIEKTFFNFNKKSLIITLDSKDHSGKSVISVGYLYYIFRSKFPGPGDGVHSEFRSRRNPTTAPSASRMPSRIPVPVKARIPSGIAGPSRIPVPSTVPAVKAGTIAPRYIHNIDFLVGQIRLGRRF